MYRFLFAISLAAAFCSPSMGQVPAVQFQLTAIQESEPQQTDELLRQLEETKAELERAYTQLDAAYETAERFGTEEELQVFRDAVGWDLDDSDMIDFNVEPDGLDSPGPGGDMGDMATQSQNPVGGLWMMWLQNDMHLYEGPGDGKRIFNTTVFQPVMPVQLNDCWKLINRPVFLLPRVRNAQQFRFQSRRLLPSGRSTHAIPSARRRDWATSP